MIYELKNNSLHLSVSSHGGELQSIQDSSNTEYLWQGDTAYWGSKAPNLFPYIARLTNGMYTLDGSTYQMNSHGFVKRNDLTLVSKSDTRIQFQLMDTAETLQEYPFHFVYMLTYELINSTISITYTVQNTDKKTMYFGLGGHPGFHVPIEKSLAFEDYELVFSTPCSPNMLLFSPTCHPTGDVEPYVLENETTIPLTHNLFDNDAIILENMAKEISLTSSKSSKGIRISYPDMTYLGLWHKPQTDAPYVCIEPWTSLPSRDGVVEDLTTQDNLISLPPGEIYRNTWTIEILHS